MLCFAAITLNSFIPQTMIFLLFPSYWGLNQHAQEHLIVLEVEHSNLLRQKRYSI